MKGSKMGTKGLLALVAVLALVGVGTAYAAGGAVIIQKEHFTINFHGNIAPSKLPRKGTAPVGVQLGAKIKTDDKAFAPKLAKIILDINKAGKFEDKGLPRCPLGQLNNSSSARAQKVCGEAEVGNGNVTSRIALPGQGEFSSNGPMLAFNGRYKGKPAIFAHVESKGKLSLTYVIIFVIQNAKGGYGKSLVADVPSIASGNGYISAFDLSLKRKYTFKGKKRSYVSASCPLPPDVNVAGFKFAKSTYVFEDGTTMSGVLNKTCKARG